MQSKVPSSCTLYSRKSPPHNRD